MARWGPSVDVSGTRLLLGTEAVALHPTRAIANETCRTAAADQRCYHIHGASPRVPCIAISSPGVHHTSAASPGGVPASVKLRGAAVPLPAQGSSTTLSSAQGSATPRLPTQGSSASPSSATEDPPHHRQPEGPPWHCHHLESALCHRRRPEGFSTIIASSPTRSPVVQLHPL